MQGFENIQLQEPFLCNLKLHIAWMILQFFFYFSSHCHFFVIYLLRLIISLYLYPMVNLSSESTSGSTSQKEILISSSTLLQAKIVCPPEQCPSLSSHQSSFDTNLLFFFEMVMQFYCNEKQTTNRIRNPGQPFTVFVFVFRWVVVNPCTLVGVFFRCR